MTIAADVERLSQPLVRDAFFIVEPNQNQLLDIFRLIDAGIMKLDVDSLFFRWRERLRPEAHAWQECSADNRNLSQVRQRNREKRFSMKPIASSISVVMEQTVPWLVLVWTILLMGQAIV